MKVSVRVLNVTNVTSQQIGPETWELKNMNVIHTVVMLMKAVMRADGFHGYGIRARRVTHIYSGLLQNY
jgi:hypothetical protein